MKSRKPDYVLLLVIGVLVIFGLVMISSASIVASQEQHQQSYYFVKNQVFRGLMPGLALGFIVYFIPYRWLKNLAFPIFILTAILLALVFVPALGVSFGGARRWLNLGSVSFQPSELLKLSFIIYLSAWLASREKDIKSFSQGLIPFVILVGIIAILLLLEPDIGTLGVIGFSAVAIYFLAGAKISHLAFIGSGSLVLFLFLVNFFSHASSRFRVFLHPETDPQGIGYQINQAIIALGSGGLFGVGLGHSLQKFKYLPQPASDSIVAVIGEELGFIGLIFLLALFVFFAWRGLKIARNAPDTFGRLLAGGITSWIAIQVLINVAAICGLLPLTGITMPFISLGGSSLAITLLAVGALLNISKYSKAEQRIKNYG